MKYKVLKEFILNGIVQKLDDYPHQSIFPKINARFIRPADHMEKILFLISICLSLNPQ